MSPRDQPVAGAPTVWCKSGSAQSVFHGTALLRADPASVDTEEKAVAQHRYYDVTETVHYGRWHMPDGRQSLTTLVTLPRQVRTPEGHLVQEPQASIEQDPVRAAWPSH